ncbi:MAG: radical SAM protein [Candidatus Omnitrophota bacterium]
MQEKTYLDLLCKLKKNNALLKAQIALTYRCNLSCLHCFENKDTSNELSLIEIKEILTQLKALGAMAVGFTGGEVFLRKDLLDILEFACRLGFAVTILTNGTLITDSLARRIIEFNPVNIRISLYGAKEDTHDSITRVRGSFKKTIKSIGSLEANNVEFAISFLVFRQNFDELRELKEIAKTRAWPIKPDYYITPRWDGFRGPLKYRVTKRQIRERVRELKLEEQVSRVSRLNKYFHFLSLGRKDCYISAQAEVFAHCNLRIKLGNLRENSLEDIWLNSKAIKVLREIDFKDLKCSECPLSAYCCWEPGLAWLEQGDFLASPRWLCKLTKSGLRRDGKLLEESLVDA